MHKYNNSIHEAFFAFNVASVVEKNTEIVSDFLVGSVSPGSVKVIADVEEKEDCEGFYKIPGPFLIVKAWHPAYS